MTCALVPSLATLEVGPEPRGGYVTGRMVIIMMMYVIIVTNYKMECG